MHTWQVRAWHNKVKRTTKAPANVPDLQVTTAARTHHGFSPRVVGRHMPSCALVWQGAASPRHPSNGFCENLGNKFQEPATSKHAASPWDAQFLLHPAGTLRAGAQAEWGAAWTPTLTRDTHDVVRFPESQPDPWGPEAEPAASFSTSSSHILCLRDGTQCQDTSNTRGKRETQDTETTVCHFDWSVAHLDGRSAVAPARSPAGGCRWPYNVSGSPLQGCTHARGARALPPQPAAAMTLSCSLHSVAHAHTHAQPVDASCTMSLTLVYTRPHAPLTALSVCDFRGILLLDSCRRCTRQPRSPPRWVRAKS